MSLENRIASLESMVPHNVGPDAPDWAAERCILIADFFRRVRCRLAFEGHADGEALYAHAADCADRAGAEGGAAAEELIAMFRQVVAAQRARLADGSKEAIRG